MKTLRISSTVLSVALLLSAQGVCAGWMDTAKEYTAQALNKTADALDYAFRPYSNSNFDEDDISEEAGKAAKKWDENFSDHEDAERLTWKERAQFYPAVARGYYTQGTLTYPKTATAVYYAALIAGACGTYKIAQWAKSKLWDKKRDQAFEATTGLSQDDAAIVKLMATDIYTGQASGLLLDALITTKISNRVSEALIEDVIIFDEAMQNNSKESAQYKEAAFNALCNFLDNYSN